MTQGRCLLAIAALALLLLAAGCGETATERKLGEARGLWRAAALDAYVLDVSGTCFGIPAPARITVEGGAVVDVRSSPAAGGTPATVDFAGMTVEEIFDGIAQIDTGNDNVDLFYDATTGAPVSFSSPQCDFQAILVAPVADAAEAGARACDSAPGSPTDVRDEPAWRFRGGAAIPSTDVWQTANGCLVRVDVLYGSRGVAHCGWESVRFLWTGRPVGSRMPERFVETGPTDTLLHFVRDPGGAYKPELAQAFASDAALPAGAVDTGFRQDGSELWIVPGDDSSVYLRTGDAVERWPRDPEPFLCE